MKIEYFWFKEYKNIRDFEANLGSNYIFNFDGKELLQIHENKNYINSFFKIDNKFEYDLEVSAVVGKNGVGKSTILDFISEYIKDTITINDYLLIYSIDGELYLDYRFDNKIRMIDLTAKKIKLTIKNFFSMEHVSIFFSNIFDVRFIGMKEENDTFDYRNISTNALLGRYKSITSFMNDEFQKQIFFIYEHRKDLEIIDYIFIPKKMRLEVIEDLNEHIEVPDFIEEGIIPIGETDDVSNSIFNLDIHEPFLKNLLKKVAQVYFIELDIIMTWIFDSNFINLDSKTIIEEAYRYANLSDKIIFDYIIEEILIILKGEENLNEEVIIKLKEDFTDLSIKFNDFYELCIKMEFIEYKPDETIVSKFEKIRLQKRLAYLKTDNPQVEKFIATYKKTFKRIELLKFTWLEMSSGQYGLLNLFSRFHAALKEIKKDKLEFFGTEQSDKAISYLLLIDEGDLYFHPQWQKDWLYYFLEMVKIIFDGHIQIILTTHSPLVLSDFPNSNVVFMDGEHLSDNQLDGSVRTFGANISELFANSFFIRDGLIGKFGKTKINSFTRTLLNSKSEEFNEEKVYFQKFIDLIGETLVKNKLIQVYKEKMDLYSDENVEDRIARLEHELMKLKNKR